jgi:hypothetical protein
MLETVREYASETSRGIDVLVTTPMGRLAAMLEPLRPDLILVTGFLWQ